MRLSFLTSPLFGIFLGLVSGCGDSAAPDAPGSTSSSGSGVAGAGGGGGGGAAGSGGEAPCPAGSHRDDAGSCAATLGEWNEAPPLAHARDHHVTFLAETAAGPFLYVAGGALDMTSIVPQIERSPIATDGSLGAWETLSVSKETAGPSVVAAGLRVLITGGMRPEGVSHKTDLVTIADDGTLTLAPGPAMLAPRFHHAMLLHGGWAYAVGGIQEDGTSQASVERIAFDEQGAGSWIAETPLPLPRSHHAVVEHGGALYVLAGLNRFDGEPFPYKDDNFSDVLRSVIAADGSLGEWTTVGQLPKPLSVHAAFVHLGQIYVVGGLEGIGNSGSFVTLVRRATIADDGTVGAFEDLPSELPIARGHCHQVPLWGGTIYSVAGANEVGIKMKSQPDAFFAHLE